MNTLKRLAIIIVATSILIAISLVTLLIVGGVANAHIQDTPTSDGILVILGVIFFGALLHKRLVSR